MIVSLIFFALVFVTVFYAGILLFGEGNVTKKRINTIAKKKQGDINTHRTNSREAANRAALQSFQNREKNSKNIAVIPRLQKKIEQSGYGFSSKTFIIVSTLLLLIVTFVLYQQLSNILIAVLVGLGVSIVLPLFLLNMAISRRQKKFLESLPDTLEMMVRGVKSGLPLNESIRAVSVEIAGPVGEEFKNISERMSVGSTMDETMESLYSRVPLPEVNFFRIVLSIQHQSGGNISEALSNLSGVLRARVTMKEKISALTAEARASSFIIGALPFVVAVLMHFTSPGYLDPLFNTDLGNKIMMIAAGLFFTGVFVLVQMVKVKY